MSEQKVSSIIVQRIIIKFLMNKNLKSTEIYEKLKNSLQMSTVFCRIKYFSSATILNKDENVSKTNRKLVEHLLLMIM